MNSKQYAAHCARRARELRRIAAGIYDKEERRMLETMIVEFQQLSLRVAVQPQTEAPVRDARGRSDQRRSNTFPRRRSQ